MLPHMLPGGKAFLYTVRRRTFTWGDEEVAVHSLVNGISRVLLTDAADARYVAPGFIVFLRRGTLFGVGFDLARLEVTGTPVPLVDGVSQALRAGGNNYLTGAGQYSVSQNGTLAWLRGTVAPFRESTIVAVDRRGQARQLNVPPQNYSTPSLSSDGRQFAFVKRSLTEMSLFTYDLSRGTQTKLLAGDEYYWPRWTPDGQRIALRSISKGSSRIVWLRSDGMGAPETLIEGAHLSSWTPDGREFAFLGSNDMDIYVATLGAEKVTARAVLATPSVEEYPEFSPDGKWLMYVSNDSGRREVYVQPYPGPGPRQQVSLAGGTSPAWNPAGGEIFFLSLPSTAGRDMMSVKVRLGPTLSLGRPRRLFTAPEWFWCMPVRCYAVSPDGQLFYGQQPLPFPPQAPVTQIQLVTNWVEELKAKVAAGQATQP